MGLISHFSASAQGVSRSLALLQRV
uniref:Uncharacterized protein n=1 Tax=Anguilla anguilla TaxID=7936 RepID=A0A0E9TCP9_ANGAN